MDVVDHPLVDVVHHPSEVLVDLIHLVALVVLILVDLILVDLILVALVVGLVE